MHVVTAWIGNTARIAERHYLQVPDEFFDQASHVEQPEEQEAAQNAAQYPVALSGKEQKVTSGQNSEVLDLPFVTAKCSSVQEAGMEMKGIEPSFPRCDRGVLPLHHIPGIILFGVIIP